MRIATIMDNGTADKPNLETYAALKVREPLSLHETINELKQKDLA